VYVNVFIVAEAKILQNIDKRGYPAVRDLNLFHRPKLFAYFLFSFLLIVNSGLFKLFRKLGYLSARL
jgi:hypothetical protein